MARDNYNPENLIADIQKGKEGAFAYIFKLYYGPLLNYAGRILKDTELANDLVQETFCYFYENREKLNVSTSLKSYLYKAVYNNCLDQLKHLKVENNYMNEKLQDFYFSKVIQKPEAELALQNEELSKAVWEAIDKLPERCREIFVLSKIKGYTNKQISEQLNISIKTVEAQMSTAFAKLRKELGWLLSMIFLSNISL